MLKAAACVLFFLEQAFLIGGAATGMPAAFCVQHPDETLNKLKLSRALYQVALVYSGYSDAREGYFCAGSLISPQWVLTAAHCLSTNTKVSDVMIAFGSTQLSKSHLASVAEIIRHEAFDRNSMVNDIALIKLADTSHGMAPISLADFEIERRALKADPHAKVSGWGSTALHAKTISDDLLYVRVPIVNRHSCAKIHKGAVTNQMLCAGDKHADTCLGDSGSGLTITYKNQRYLEGIVSWGEGCGEANKPGVYTRIPSYLEWINAHMK